MLERGLETYAAVIRASLGIELGAMQGAGPPAGSARGWSPLPVPPCIRVSRSCCNISTSTGCSNGRIW
ncbi:hypothetical protein [Paracoccus cavernae]|uniref:hypothetical protein n=1 Tax=Paracoccus cavernae TaxID=1571207 RepID=UPI0036353B04